MSWLAGCLLPPACSRPAASRGRMPPEASVACLFMSLQATSAQRTRTNMRGLWGGKEMISEKKLRNKAWPAQT